MSCHGEAETSMKGAAPPAEIGRQAQEAGQARTADQYLPQRAHEGSALGRSSPAADRHDRLSRRYQSRGMPVTGEDLRPDVDHGSSKRQGDLQYAPRPARLAWQLPRAEQRQVQCAPTFSARGMTNGFPTYRLSDQRLVQLQ